MPFDTMLIGPTIVRLDGNQFFVSTLHFSAYFPSKYWNKWRKLISRVLLPYDICEIELLGFKGEDVDMFHELGEAKMFTFPTAA